MGSKTRASGRDAPSYKVLDGVARVRGGETIRGAEDRTGSTPGLSGPRAARLSGNALWVARLEEHILDPQGLFEAVDHGAALMGLPPPSPPPSTAPTPPVEGRGVMANLARSSGEHRPGSRSPCWSGWHAQRGPGSGRDPIRDRARVLS